MNLTGLHFLLSYRCTFECDHCFVYSSPRAEGTMTLGQVKYAMDQAKTIPSISVIYLEGGEPLLFYPLALEAAKYARKLGLEVGLVSNGYYATTVEDAKLWLRPFAELGIADFSFSADEYHSANRDGDTPGERAHKAAEELGIECGTICIDPPRSEPNEKKPGEPIIGGGVRFRGRAVDELGDSDLPRRHWETLDRCPDEDFVKIGRLHLDPYGNLSPCQGIVIGNLWQTPLTEIVDSYRPDTHPIIDPIHRGGPAALVRERNLPLQGEYLDECHLCYLARKMLRNSHRTELAPAQVYGEEE